MLPRKMKGPFGTRAFTLIELLIVIAIILILIAIALPNFLEAQVRAKITKCEAEMRGLALALESYRTDWPRYPPQTAYEATQFLPLPTLTGNVFSLMALTTPIAYIAQLPLDIFAPPNGDTLYNGSTGNPINLHPSDKAHGLTYLYWSQDSLRYNGQITTADQMKRHGIHYSLQGVGPDADLDSINLDPNDMAQLRVGAVAWAYSATNGTKSSGDLIRTQP